MNLFYSNQIEGNHIILDENDSRHSIKVLRLGLGDTLYVTDGLGKKYKTTISDPNAKRTRLEIQEEFSVKDLSYNLHVAIAPTKNIDRFEWFLEKATEMGISEITPILCHHSERKVIKEGRLKKVLVSAMKQSLKARLPLLNRLTSYGDLITKVQAEHKFIAHCHSQAQPETLNPTAISKALVLIGPEGDFSHEEVDQALRAGYRPVSLGSSRLRTETAGVYVVSKFYQAFEDH